MMDPPRTRRGPAALAWALCALTVALSLAAAIALVADPRARGPSVVSPSGPGPDDTPRAMDALDVAVTLLQAIVFSAFAGVGAVVAARRPRNAVGWLFVVSALFLALGSCAGELYSHISLGHADPDPLADALAWFMNWSWLVVAVLTFGLVPLLFPTGAPPGPGWRPLVWAAAALGGAAILATALAPGPLDSGDSPWVDNPLGVEGLALRAVANAAFWAWAATAAVSIGSLVVRYRRARDMERLQLRWVAAAGCGLIASGVVAGALTSVLGTAAGWLALLCGLLVMAAAVAVALLRYRLYDFDVVVNRALVYGALTLTLGAAYLVTVLLANLALRPLTSESQAAVAASTLAVAALFRPARARIQRAVDRRFFRRRYDAARTLEGFGTRIRREVELDAVSADLCSVVAETMQPAHVSLWLRTPDPDR